MRIVQPHATIVHFMGLPAFGRELLFRGEFATCRDYGTEAMRLVEETGRICYRSEDAVTDTSYEPFIQKRVLDARHTSMLRFSQVVVDFYVDRGVAQEILRHLFTLAGQMESQRYCNYSHGKHGNNVKFVKPYGMDPDQTTAWDAAMRNAEYSYFELLTKGLKPQLAADVLPRATVCLVRLVGNFQAWRHFLLTRTTDACHPKLLDVTARAHIREVEAGKTDVVLLPQPSLLDQFKTVFPLLFDDIVPFGKHVENMSKVR